MVGGCSASEDFIVDPYADNRLTCEGRVKNVLPQIVYDGVERDATQTKWQPEFATHSVDFSLSICAADARGVSCIGQIKAKRVRLIGSDPHSQDAGDDLGTGHSTPSCTSAAWVNAGTQH